MDCDVHFVKFAVPDVLQQIESSHSGSVFRSYLIFQAHEGELFVQWPFSGPESLWKQDGFRRSAVFV